MDWNTYKTDVSASREIIVFPFFKKYLDTQSGIGIDIGCGDGDLTNHIATTSKKIVGIDFNQKDLKKAREKYDKNHFFYGDIEKNSIPSLGIKYDFAFSNCCFSHISDQGIYSVFIDLHSCMKIGGELIFLVPSLSWAQEMYSEIIHVPGGITATPRYGGRQSFRIPEWYISALEKCGFELVHHEELFIPNNKKLEQRYRSKEGSPLFSAFVARKIKDIPSLDSLQKAFDIAHENRKLEISLFWQRSLFFWGFVATAVVGYGAVYEKSMILTLICSLFGLVCSIVWSAGNRGSKYWQEYWEKKVSFYQHYTTGNIFFDRAPKKPKIFERFAARRISVSKLTMALSDYMVFLWFALCFHTLEKKYFVLSEKIHDAGPVILLLITLIYCLYFLRFSKSED